MMQIMKSFFKNLFEIQSFTYLKCFIYSLVSAFFMMLAFSSYFLFAFIALIPVMIVLLKTDFKKSLFSLIVFVLFFHTYLMSWTAFQFHPLALPGLLLYTVLIYMLTLFVFRFVSKNFSKEVAFLAIPICFTLLDYFRNLGFLRYPYGVFAYSQSDFLAFIQIADITGYLGVSFVLYLINAVLANHFITYSSLNQQKEFFLKTYFFFSKIGFVSLVFLGILIYGILKQKQLVFEEAKNTKTPLKVGLVQMWFDFNQPINRYSKKQLSRKLFTLSDKAKEKEVDLIFWPESALLDYYKYRLENGLNEFSSYFYQYFSSNTNENLYFLIGSLGTKEKKTFEGPLEQNEKLKSAKDYKTKGLPKKKFEIFNTAFFIGPKGNILQEYSKIFLVPFVEWFPYAKYIPFLKMILKQAQASNFTPGKEMIVFKHPKILFSILICYDDCFAILSRKATLKGAEMLVVITNDAWSYTEKAEILHYDFSIFRAIENRRPFLRVSNAGVTCLINQRGQKKGHLPLFTEGVLIEEVTPRKGKTLYTRFGNQVMLWLLVGLAGWGFFKKRKIEKGEKI